MASTTTTTETTITATTTATVRRTTRASAVRAMSTVNAVAAQAVVEEVTEEKATVTRSLPKQKRQVKKAVAVPAVATTPSPPAEAAVEDAPVGEEAETKPKRKGRAKKVAEKGAAGEKSQSDAAAATTPSGDQDNVETKPKLKGRAKKSRPVVQDDGEATQPEGTDETAPPPPPRGKKRKRAAASKSTVDPALAAEGTEGEAGAGEDAEMAPPKPKRRRRAVEEPVYVIPDVEKKSTTFKGRLGYACLNTVLRNKKPATESVFCSRTCRIDSIKKNGIEWVKELGRKNVQDLLQLIQWNEDNHIRFMRLSSEMFPFASHPKYGYSLSYCAPLLAEAGALANKYGHRLTVHPGQYTQLGSNKPAVIDSAVRELEYHCEMLDLMGVGKDGVMIVHGGGVYEDKEKTIERIKKTIRERLPEDVRARLVLENDEMCYNAEELLGICEELDVPLVFDYHHDWINPSSIPPKEIIARANAIFEKRGIRPKQHLSEPRPGAVTVMERRAHADRCQSLPVDLPDDMDLMIEAKDKEQAVLHLYRMYDLHLVKHESLRPPADNQTKETKGRKSNKRAQAGEGPSPSKKKAKAKARKKVVSSDDDDSELSVLEDDFEGESEGSGSSASGEEHSEEVPRKGRATSVSLEEEPRFVGVEGLAVGDEMKPETPTRRSGRVARMRGQV